MKQVSGDQEDEEDSERLRAGVLCFSEGPILARRTGSLGLHSIKFQCESLSVQSASLKYSCCHVLTAVDLEVAFERVCCNTEFRYQLQRLSKNLSKELQRARGLAARHDRLFLGSSAGAVPVHLSH